MYEKLNKKAITCMFVNAIILFIVSGLFLTIPWIAANVYLKNDLKTVIHVAIISILILDLLNLIFSPKIRYSRYRYLINNEKIDIIEGFIFIQRNIVPIKRIQKISIKQGPIDKIFKLAKVEVTTAGGDVTIRFLEEYKAEEIAESLKKEINIIVQNEVAEDEGK